MNNKWMLLVALAGFVVAANFTIAIAQPSAGEGKKTDAPATAPADDKNLMKNPSFEQLREKPHELGWLFADQFGWKYEQPAKLTLGTIAHSGKYSYGIVNGNGGKARYQSPDMKLDAGRYRVSFFVRGLDNVPLFKPATVDMMAFDGNYRPVVLPGTFGWTPVTCVFQADKPIEKGQLHIGLVGSGWLWIDDIVVEKVDSTVELTKDPVAGKEEAPIAPPSKINPDAMHCPECGFRNNREWKACYACGALLEAKKEATVAGPLVKALFDFENGKAEPFENAKITEENAPQGKYALKIEGDWSACEKPQDWSGYDVLKVDVFNPHDAPVMFGIEIRDAETTGYYTRVNYSTIVPPGKSTVSLSTSIFVGEKGRPGRPLMKSKVTRLVFVPEKRPMLVDSIRLERIEPPAVFDGLQAFDFGLSSSPVMAGYTQILPNTLYSEGRGLGWTGDSTYTRGFDCLQPDGLFQDFILPQGAGFRVDVPNGKYHVIMNIDCPGGFWGEVQSYTNRQVIVNGKTVVDDKMTVEEFQKWYFRNAHKEDPPGLDTFTQYVQGMFNIKQFDVDVTDGKIAFDFKGEGMLPIALSTLVIYPDSKADAGKKFWDWTTRQRESQFNDYFKQVTPKAVGAKAPADGYVVFARSTGLVNGNDGPQNQDALPAEGLSYTIAKGEEQPMKFAVQPGIDLGEIAIAVSDFTGPNGAKLDARSFQPGWIDYRITRVTMEGSVYTIKPRYWHPAPCPNGKVTRNIWVRTKIADNAIAGRYTGKVTITPKNGSAKNVPVTITVLPFALGPVTDIAAGPWGCSIGLPFAGTDPKSAQWNDEMFGKVLEALHQNGFTTVTGLPNIGVKAAGGKVELDFTRADKEMKALRDHGFNMMISSYGAGLAYNMYGDANGPDETYARNAGFANAETFLKALYGQIEEHAKANNWVPVAWNLCDEPLADGGAAAGSAKNAALHTKVATDLGLKLQTFMGATSMTGSDPRNPHYDLITSLIMPSLNDHDEASIKLVQDKGHKFSFYNGGTRWAYGRYMKTLVAKYSLAYEVTWHLNVVAGDPYYALDCREDDYCFYNTDENMTLVPSMSLLGGILPGLNDYRYLSTLERLVKEKAGSPAAAEAKKVYEEQIKLVAGKDRPEPKDPAVYENDRKAVTKAILSLMESK